MQYITAGESHGPKLTTIVSGVPAGLTIDIDAINSDLARRQGGYGRGGRQLIETDKATITSGVRFGKTTGAPIAIEVENRDWANWTERMAHFGDVPSDYNREVTPRPGHADLVGALRSGTRDCRDVLERASARETAARVAAGGIARALLKSVGVACFSFVTSIGSAKIERDCLSMASTVSIADIESSVVRCPDEHATRLMTAAVDAAKESGESLGGTFCVVARGLVPGLGSYVTGTERLTSRLAGAICSIPAIKGVEFGLGFESAARVGSQVHDPIILDNAQYLRKSNNAGGLEGGMTTGSPLIITAAMKPIPTLMNPLETVNIDTHAVEQASRERSDVCAVPAAAVVAESEVAFVLANSYLETFGCTCLEDLSANIAAYKNRLEAHSS